MVECLDWRFRLPSADGSAFKDIQPSERGGRLACLGILACLRVGLPLPGLCS